MTPLSDRELREIDARVAEKVMGWEWCDVRLRGETNRVRVLLPPGNEFRRADGQHDASDFVCGLRNFSTDIAAAFTVVEKMQEDGWEWSLSGAAFEAYPPSAQFWRNLPGGETQTAVEPTLPLAICRAALRALEGGEE